MLVGCGASSFDREQLPPDIQSSYDAFRFHCSRCHTLSRPLTARVSSTEHWDQYVARMRRMPGSGISEANSKVILKFLYYYTLVIRGEGQTEEVIEDALETSPEPTAENGGSQPAGTSGPTSYETNAGAVGAAPSDLGTEELSDERGDDAGEAGIDEQ